MFRELGERKPSFKNNFYIMYQNGDFILTNTETHDSYILSPDKIALLAKPEGVYDEDFIEAGIIDQTGIDENKDNWPYMSITKFFKQTLSIHQKEIEILEKKEFWEGYLGVCEESIRDLKPIKEQSYIKTIELPKANKVEIDFYSALANRRTTREFHNQPISLQDLSDILYITFGRFHENFEDKYLDFDKTVSWRRTSPSAGGLHCVHPYLFIMNVEGLKPGIYYYAGKQNELRLVEYFDKNEFEKELISPMLGQHFYEGASLHILTVGNLYIVAQKYLHSKSVLFPYLENGHLMQTALLLATGKGIQTWISAAFADEYFIKKLKLQEAQIPLTFVSLGYGSKESLGPKIHKVLEEIGCDRMLAALAMNQVKEKVRLK